MPGDSHANTAVNPATSEPNSGSGQVGNLTCSDGVAPEVFWRILANEAKMVREQKREFQKN